MGTIVQSNDPILRKTAIKVPVEDIQSKKIKAVIAEMKELLGTQDDGVAIAAPQIGKSLRIFVVSGLALKAAIKNYTGDESYMAFVNPEILKSSREKIETEEGCLSVRWKYGKTKRAKKVLLRAYDENGNIFERGASGLLAQIFQHETDHLNGILFTDKAYDVADIPPENQKKERVEKEIAKKNNG